MDSTLSGSVVILRRATGDRRHLFTEHEHHRLVIDPSADNEAAIHAYTKVGFRPVGIMRRYERRPDGTWHDGLLMDLLPEDLTVD